MKSTITEPTSWKKIIHCEIPDEDYHKEFELKLKEYKKKVKLPGFRQGKVPESILNNRFGQSIKADVLDDIINKTFKQVCTEKKIIPICEPKINELKAEVNQPVTFSIEFEVDPAIEIKGYKKLKIKTSPKKIKDSDVDAALDELKDRMAKLEDVDRASKKGDYVSLEYLKAVVDGQIKNDIKSPNYPIEIGKGTLKDFDKGLIGLTAGQESTFSVKFPKEYHVADVAGKSAEMTVKVTKVQEKIVPEINEEFLKNAGNFADVEALRAAVRQDLEAQDKDRVLRESHDKAIDAVIEDNDFEVPPSRVEGYIDHVLEEEAKYHPPGKGPTREAIAERFRENGIRAIKRYRIIDYIAKKENIKATQEEVDNKIKALADTYKQSFEEVKDRLRKSGATLRIREDIIERKVLDSLIGDLPWEKSE